MRRIGLLVTSIVAAALMVAFWSATAFATSEPVPRPAPPYCEPWTWDWFWSPGAHWWYWQYWRWCYEPMHGWFVNWGMWGWW